MPTYNVTVSIKEDGQELPGFPVSKSLTVTESGGRASISRPDSASYTELPLSDLGQIELLYVEASQISSLRFNDQSDGGLPLGASGFLLLCNCAIPTGASNKASLQTNTGSAATVVVVAGGS